MKNTTTKNKPISVAERINDLANEWADIGHVPAPMNVDYTLARRGVAFELFGGLRFWAEPSNENLGLYVVVGHAGSRSIDMDLAQAMKLAQEMHELSSGVACFCSICELIEKQQR